MHSKRSKLNVLHSQHKNTNNALIRIALALFQYISLSMRKL